MQHQALKYAPSLVTDGQFTQGLSHWFGSYVKHTKDSENNLYSAECSARPAGAYQVGMPYGISQYIDSPEMHSYPASRTASLVRMVPLSRDLVLLVTTGDTLLEGGPLVPGIAGESSPYDLFQHPFRWQDADGAVNIEPTSRMSVRDGAYSGEYAVGSLLVSPASTPQDVVHHRLYAAPDTPLAPEASDETYGSVRVECLPAADLASGTMTFRSSDEDQLNRLRVVIAQLGAGRLTLALGTDLQVQLVALVGQVTAGGPNEYRLEVTYEAISPGGLAPDQASSFVEWAVFRIADVQCKYTMPLYGYRYTLAYSYRGRRPRRAELTFRRATEGPDGYTLSGFGDADFSIRSDALLRSLFGAAANYSRNIEVLRAESRNKVVGRPLLTIPVLDVSEPQAQSRTVTRVRRLASTTETYVDADAGLVDTEARNVFGIAWEEGISGATPAKLWLPGIVNPANLPSGVVAGQSLGPVVFTGHLAGQSTRDGLIDSVEKLLATILYGYGLDFEVDAELFFGDGPLGELYVQFTINGVPLYLSTDVRPGAAATPENQTYYVDVSYGDTLGIRGDHFGASLELQIPRLRPGKQAVFSDAEGDLLFLNDNAYPILDVYLPPIGGGVRTIEYTLGGVSLPTQVTYDVSPALGTQIGLLAEVQGGTTAHITDVSMWLGERTNDLPLDGQSGRDLLERHTDPLSSMFPRGTVMLYAGGGACPAGFKPVQAQAESFAPGLANVTVPQPINTSWDEQTNTTLVEFPLGSLPTLRDGSGAPVSRTAPITRAVPAPSLEVDSTGTRLPALTASGTAVNLSQVLQVFRNAIEVGMTLRVQESTAEDAAPLVSEDRGFLVVDDVNSDAPSTYTAASALRSARERGVGFNGGYHFQDAEDIDAANIPGETHYDPNSPAYHWGRGYGTVTYPSADQNAMAIYPGEEGYNRSEDQALLRNDELGPDFLDAMGGETYGNYRLLPKYPTRFTQTPQFAPVAPGIWGQRERFFFDSPDDVTPNQNFTDAPSPTNLKSPAILSVCRGFVNDTQMEFGFFGGESRIGMPGGQFGYLPNPAWDLMDLSKLDAATLAEYPPQPVQANCDLLSGQGWTAGQGRIKLYEGMVFFTRIYAKCPENQWDEELGRPVPGAAITGWFDGESAAPGIGFLLGTMPLTTYAIQSGPAITYQMNVNVHPYDFPEASSNARGNAPRAGRAGATWPTTMRMTNSSTPAAGIFLMQMTPISLYGSPGQPQEYGDVSYLDWSTGEYETARGRFAGFTTQQSAFTYTRADAAADLVQAWGTTGPGTSAQALKVLGNASGLETGGRPIYVEPSGYLKYGSVGARMDYGPGSHAHELKRNPNLLGPMNLAQPNSTEDELFVALPSVHGHSDVADSRSVLPVANLFTSCIKL